MQAWFRYFMKFPSLWFKYALAYLLRGARHALHDILLLRTSAIRRRLYLGRRLDSHQDEFALLATYRGGSLIYFQDKIYSAQLCTICLPRNHATANRVCAYAPLGFAIGQFMLYLIAARPRRKTCHSWALYCTFYHYLHKYRVKYSLILIRRTSM